MVYKLVAVLGRRVLLRLLYIIVIYRAQQPTPVSRLPTAKQCDRISEDFSFNKGNKGKGLLSPPNLFLFFVRVRKRADVHIRCGTWFLNFLPSCISHHQSHPETRHDSVEVMEICRNGAVSRRLDLHSYISHLCRERHKSAALPDCQEVSDPCSTGLFLHI